MPGLRVEPKVSSDIRVRSVHHHKQKKKTPLAITFDVFLIYMP